MKRSVQGLLVAVALVVTGVVLHGPERGTHTGWHAGDLSSSLRAYFAETLPALSTEDADTLIDRPRLKELFPSLIAGAAEVPGLSGHLADFGRALDDPRTTRVDLLRLGIAMNGSLHDADVPVFVDLDVGGGWSGTHRANIWTIRVRTYFIDRVHTRLVDGKPFTALWVERLDERQDNEQAIGIKKGGMPYSLILLHQLRRQWYETVLPTITGHARDARARMLYRHHQNALRSEMLDALKGRRTPSGRAADAVLSRMLTCMEPALALPGDDGIECAETFAEVEAVAVELMGDVVERHELHHAARVLSSPVLDEEWAGKDAALTRTATSEVAATLVEMALGETPRMSLVQALSIPRWRRRTADGLAAIALGNTLMKQTPEVQNVDALVELPPAELRQRAARAYRLLFSVEVPRFEAR